MRARLNPGLLIPAWLAVALPAQAACVVDARPVTFGVVDVSRVTFSTGRIEILCEEAVTVAIALSSTAGGQRRMIGPGDRGLVYELYTDATYRQVWGDGRGRGVPVQAAVAAGERRRLTVYGVVPAQPGVPAGRYAAQLVISITF